MLLVDAIPAFVLATDIIDGGNTSTPPTDFYDSAFLMVPQVAIGAITPSFNPVGTTEAINPGSRQALHVRVGGTATTVTVQVPGRQPYTNAERDDSTTGSVTSTERIWQLAPLLVDSTDSIVVLYSQTTAVTAALLQVG